jgi:hypothetical protein
MEMPYLYTAAIASDVALIQAYSSLSRHERRSATVLLQGNTGSRVGVSRQVVSGEVEELATLWAVEDASNPAG